MDELILPPYPKVAIIVLNYRGRDCLLPCLCTLTALDYPNKEIIVVDNASHDGSIEMAQKEFPSLCFSFSKNNRGFAAGMNQGIRLALFRGAEYVWLFNNDAEAEKTSLRALIQIAEANKGAGIISPLVLEKNKEKIWFAAARVNFFRMRTEHVLPRREQLLAEYYDSEILTGCALLIKRTAIEKVGLLDERFFLYYEDAEYSLRVQKAGLRALVVPRARVWHSEESEKSSQKLYFLVLSGLLFFGQQATFGRRLYLAAYVTIRRIKNIVDQFLRRPNACFVAKAYKQYFYDHSPFLLPRHR